MDISIEITQISSNTTYLIGNHQVIVTLCIIRIFEKMLLYLWYELHTNHNYHRVSFSN
jgi:hypothetical protein